MAENDNNSSQEEFKYLVRIGGTDIDGNKKAATGLTSIKGVGIRTADIIINMAGIDVNKRIGYLTDKEAEKLDQLVTNYTEQRVPSWLFNRRKDYNTGRDMHLVGSDVLITLREDINRLKKTKSYRGIRHNFGLPVRGQRTKTSFRHKGGSVGVRKRRSPE